MTTPNESELTSMAFILTELQRLSGVVDKLRDIELRHLDDEIQHLSEKVDKVFSVLVAAMETAEWKHLEKTK